MNYDNLADELANDPLSRGYASMDSYVLRDSLNNKDRSSYQTLTSNELLKWSGINGRYIKIKTAAENTSLTDEIRSAAYAAVVMVDRDNTVFDYNDSNSQDIMNILVTNNVISESDKTDLIKSATVLISRAEELTLPKLRKKDIERAQNGG